MVDEAVRLVPVAVAVEIVAILLVKLGEIDGGVARHLDQRLLHQIPDGVRGGVGTVVGGVLAGGIPARHLAAHAVALAGLLLVELAHGGEPLAVRAGIALGREQQIVVVRRGVVRVVHLGELGAHAVLRVVGEVHQDGEDLVLAHLALVVLPLDSLEQQGRHPIAGTGGAVQADLLEDGLPHLALFHRQGAAAALIGPRLLAIEASQGGLLLLGGGQGRNAAALLEHLQHLHLVGQGGIERTVDRGGHGLVSNHKG